jgi:D-galactarolactone cycloisomerase
MGEVAQRLDITVSAGEQTYTLQGLKDLIDGRRAHGAAGHRQDGRRHGTDGSARRSPHAHGVELVPHQPSRRSGTSPIPRPSAIMHLASRGARGRWERAGTVFENPSRPVDGRFAVPTAPGLGLGSTGGDGRRSIPIG